MLAPVPHWLTPREQDVATLLARGLSTSEIARQLVVFPATVTTHVEHILQKLGFQHRVQIATWAAQQRLWLSDAHDRRP
jgi:DNA-binding NarL/FixJ family response regulator